MTEQTNDKPPVSLTVYCRKCRREFRTSGQTAQECGMVLATLPVRQVGRDEYECAGGCGMEREAEPREGV